ncbi:MAG TPA: PLP-dependent aspartate aminotransferase family protein [Bryobacteraceae bacterium]|nr:PLP-dependent aspartate aminotransferase family protein [Bryobacteraceae bacterium]
MAQDIFTKAVHAGDRKQPGTYIPVTTPIYTASSFICRDAAELDRVAGREEPGFSYARYDNPTNAALEELVTALENGFGSLACSSGMAAVQIAIATALNSRPKKVVCADAVYGATVGVLERFFKPLGVAVEWVDICDLDAVAKAVPGAGCVLMETISNPLLRVGAIDRVAELAHAAGACFVVDSTFATPMLIRPLELGADMVVHSVTKYLAGHGDVLGGIVVSTKEHYETLRMLSRAYGPVLGPFESYLAMRGIKTFPLRMERQCANACRIATALAQNPAIERVYYPADPAHPDAATIRRLLPEGPHGAIVTFEVKGADKAAMLRFMDRLKLVVSATTLGDVQSLVLYPLISSHRDVPPAQRARMGIKESLIRLSAGIESADDILADLEQALA